MIQLTDSASTKAKDLVEKKGSDVKGIRIGVRGGGCSGFSYFLEFAESFNSQDKELDFDGLKVYVDSKSYLYLLGVEVDYIDDIGQSGFKFNNPNARRTCGCGESFSV